MVPGEGVGERPQLVPPDTELGAGGEAEPADVRTHQRQPEHRELSSKEISNGIVSLDYASPGAPQLLTGRGLTRWRNCPRASGPPTARTRGTSS